MGHKFVSVFALSNYFFYSMWNEIALRSFTLISWAVMKTSALGSIGCWLAGLKETGGKMFGATNVYMLHGCTISSGVAFHWFSFDINRSKYWQLKHNSINVPAAKVSCFTPVEQSHTSSLDQNRLIKRDFSFGSQVTQSQSALPEVICAV